MKWGDSKRPYYFSVADVKLAAEIILAMRSAGGVDCVATHSAFDKIYHYPVVLLIFAT